MRYRKRSYYILLMVQLSAAKAELVVASVSLILMGAILLLIWVVEITGRGVRRLTKRPPDPAMMILSPMCDGRPVQYEESKERMVRLLMEQLYISSEEARAKVNQLEKIGKIVYLPNGKWARGE